MENYNLMSPNRKTKKPSDQLSEGFPLVAGLVLLTTSGETRVPFGDMKEVIDFIPNAD